ncbi:hypothetical protein ACQEU3_05255 [Spirillospora sp. CA-253888]
MANRMRWTVGAVLLAGALVPGTGTAQAGPSVQVVTETKSFGNCKKARAWFKGGAVASVATVKVDYPYGPTRLNDHGGAYWEASARLAVKINVRASKIELTLPAWRKMTKRDRAAVRTFEGRLLDHEEAHFEMVQGLLRHFGTAGAVGTAGTREGALQKLEASKKGVRDNVQSIVKLRSNDYEKGTDHGRKQSAIGGKNVALTCA